MSDNSRIKLMKKYTRSWYPHQANLIYMISKYSVTYVPLPANRKLYTKLDKAKWDDAWIEISSKLDQPVSSCKQLWTNIKFKYAKIMKLISTGKITKMAAMSHPETARFFDGRLSFMDPYICEIGDTKIPFIIHKSINKLFNLKTKKIPKTTASIKPKTSSIKPDRLIITHAQVKTLLSKRELQENNYSDNKDTNSLQMVIQTAVKCKLEELLQLNNTSSNPFNDIVNNNDEHAVNVTTTPSEKLQNVHKSESHFILIPSDEENTCEHINLGLQSELIIEDEDEIKIEHADDNLMMEDDVGNIIMEDEDDIMNEKEVILDREEEDSVIEENIVIDKNLNYESNKKVDLGNIVPIIMPGACTILEDLEDEVSDTYIRNFFKELGEVMSLELNTAKQKTLKSRINELLKSVLVSEEVRVLTPQRIPPLRLE